MRKTLIISGAILYFATCATAEDWRAQFDTLVKSQAGPQRDSLITGIVSAKPAWSEVMTKSNR